MSRTKKGMVGTRTGAVLSAETKAKIAASKLGTKMSSEACAKMSAARKGKAKSKEHMASLRTNHWSRGPRALEIAAKIAKANYGHPVSAETRARISIAKSG